MHSKSQDPSLSDQERAFVNALKRVWPGGLGYPLDGYADQHTENAVRRLIDVGVVERLEQTEKYGTPGLWSSPPPTGLPMTSSRTWERRHTQRKTERSLPAKDATRDRASPRRSRRASNRAHRRRRPVHRAR